MASSKEVGVTKSDYQYAAEGTKFDLFVDQTARANFATLTNIIGWWLRSAYSYHTNAFCYISELGSLYNNSAGSEAQVVPAFVIG